MLKQVFPTIFLKQVNIKIINLSIYWPFNFAKHQSLTKMGSHKKQIDGSITTT
jgi:hypothetical protein